MKKVKVYFAGVDSTNRPVFGGCQDSYKVTIFVDCHAAHNIKFRNQSQLEADSIKRLANKFNYPVSVRKEVLH